LGGGAPEIMRPMVVGFSPLFPVAARDRARLYKDKLLFPSKASRSYWIEMARENGLIKSE
jgi:hypothetical protein